MLSVKIACKDNDERDRVGYQLHEALKGSWAYVHSDILLNIEEEKTILLLLGDLSAVNRTLNLKTDDVSLVDSENVTKPVINKEDK